MNYDLLFLVSVSREENAGKNVVLSVQLITPQTPALTALEGLLALGFLEVG